MSEFDKEKAPQHLEEIIANEPVLPKGKRELEEELAQLEAVAALWRRRLEDVVLAHQWVLAGSPGAGVLGELVETKAFLATELARVYSKVMPILRELASTN